MGRKKAAVWDSLEPKKRSGVAFQLIGALESIAVETATAVTADWLVETESIGECFVEQLFIFCAVVLSCGVELWC